MYGRGIGYALSFSANTEHRHVQTPEAEPPPPARTPSQLISRLGPLRLGLAVLVALCLPMAFFANVEPSGWRVIPVYVAPVLVVILIWVLLLDLLMSRVLMAEKPPQARQPYQMVMRLDGALLVALLVFWGPFYYGLVNG